MWKVMQDNVEDLLSPDLWRSLTCETLGTLVVVLLGCGAWVPWSAPDVVQISLAFGLAVATMVWVFSHISGGHYNPAVTTAALVTRRVSIIRGVLYIVAQIIGGIVGAGALYGLTPSARRGDLGATIIATQSGVTAAQAFGVELLITFVFVLAVFASRDTERTDLAGSSPLTIGLTVVVCHLFAIDYTRASMNSARSFGPAVIMGIWENHWVYWVGPLTGGAAAGLLYDYIFSAGATLTKARKCLLRTKKAEQEKAPLDGAPAPEVIEIEETAAGGSKDETAPPGDEDNCKVTEDSAKE